MDHWSDYVIFTLFLLISLSIGVYHGCTGDKQRTPEDFMLGNRQLQLIPTTISLVVSFTSAILIIGNGAEVYYGGLAVWPGILIALTLALIISERLLVPWLYSMRLTSVNKVFQLRFGSKILRIYAALLSIFVMVNYTGTATLACSIALETATGFPANISIGVMMAVCSIYTSIGGMRAVIWTDVFQFAIYVFGMLAILIKAWLLTGFHTSMNHVFEGNRFSWETLLSPDMTVRHTLWGYTFGMTMYSITTHGIHQTSLQRYGGMASLKNARISILLKIPVLWILFSIASVTGLLIFGYHAERRCDPFLSGQIKKTNEMVPLFVKTMFSGYKGFSGFFLVTLYSGGLSSVSSALSSASTCFWDDILSHKYSKLSPFKKALISRISVLVFGIGGTGIAFFAASVQGPLSQVSIKIASLVKGPLFGMYLLAGFRSLRWVNSNSTLIGSVTSLALMIWITVGGVFTPKARPMPMLPVDGCELNITAPAVDILPDRSIMQSIYSMSYIWNTLVSTLITVVIALLASLLTNRICSRRDPDPHPDYIYIDWHDAISWNKKLHSTPTQQELEHFETNQSGSL